MTINVAIIIFLLILFILKWFCYLHLDNKTIEY